MINKMETDIFFNRLSIAQHSNAIVLEGPRKKTEVREMEKKNKLNFKS